MENTKLTAQELKDLKTIETQSCSLAPNRAERDLSASLHPSADVCPVPGICYMLRIDVVERLSYVLGSGTDILPHFEQVQLPLFLKKFKLDPNHFKYIIAYEIAPETKKRHLQCVVWFPTEPDKNTKTKIRNWFKAMPITMNTYQNVAFKKGRSELDLIKYCLKDDYYKTNLNKEMISKLPKWVEFRKRKKTTDELAKIKRENLYAQCLKITQTLIAGIDEYFGASNSFKKKLCVKYSEIYYSIYQTAIRRQTQFQLLFRYKQMTHEEYVDNLMGAFFSDNY